MGKNGEGEELNGMTIDNKNNRRRSCERKKEIKIRHVNESVFKGKALVCKEERQNKR